MRKSGLTQVVSSAKAGVMAQGQESYLSKALERPPSPERAKELVLGFMKDSGLRKELDRIVKLK